MRTGTLEVDGAHLHYEIRGVGPALVLIVGAGGDAGMYDGLADELGDTFTVITYDRRGNSRSSGAGAPTSLAQQASDAKAIIDAFAGGAALVFGNSGGALVGLVLAAQFPAEVRGLIAHEPPAMRALPESDPARTWFDSIASIYENDGAQAAAGAFVSQVRGEGSYEWPEELQRRFLGNIEQLFGTEWSAFSSFEPDYEALRNAAFPIVLAAGSADRGTNYARPSIAIAEQIGATWAEFPGIHLEFLRNPAIFAAALRTLATEIHSRTDVVPGQWAAAEFLPATAPATGQPGDLTVG
jgi:pimeloyl-ACP methyl ester carboxylesterase